MVVTGKCGDAMAYTFAELGKGKMARARDNRFKSGRNLGHTLYCHGICYLSLKITGFRPLLGKSP